MDNFDYIIIGAGSAGCVLANRLTANPMINVLLLEAGGKDTYPWIHIPVGYYKTMHNLKTDWCFKTEPDKNINGRSINYPRGKTLGGSSSINGLLYIRGQSQDYDMWRQQGNTGWGWNDVLPYFIKSENQERGRNEFHGINGPLSVSDIRIKLSILDEFRNAAEEVGIPKIKDFNTGDNFGCDYFQVTEKNGLRCSTAVGYLNPAKKRSNLKVEVKAHVKQINFEGKKAIGISYWKDNQLITIKADKEVILSAGSIGSPQIMMLSGLGDGNELSALGINVEKHIPGVGKNLQDHLQIRTAFKVKNVKTLNQMYQSYFSLAKMGLEYLFLKRGPLTMAPSQFGIFTKSNEIYETPNIEFHVQPLSLDKFGDPLHKFPALTVSVCNLRPKSIGTVSLASSNHLDQPIIAPNYLSDPEDKQVAVESINKARSLMSTSEMSYFEPKEFLPGTHFTKDNELIEEAGKIATTIFHPVGTAKMGMESDKQAVVNFQLKVRGLKNLRVVDGSVMPTITSGNTHAPIVMIAEKASAMILKESQK